MFDFWFLVDHWKAIVVVIVVLAIVLPFISVFSSIVTIMTPLLTAAMEFLVWLVKEIISGMQVVLTNIAAVVFMLALLLMTGFYIHTSDHIQCKAELKAQHDSDYEFYQKLWGKSRSKTITKILPSRHK